MQETLNNQERPGSMKKSGLFETDKNLIEAVYLSQAYITWIKQHHPKIHEKAIRDGIVNIETMSLKTAMDKVLSELKRKE